MNDIIIANAYEFTYLQDAVQIHRCVDIFFSKLNEAEINVSVIYVPKRWFSALLLKTSLDVAQFIYKPVLNMVLRKQKVYIGQKLMFTLQTMQNLNCKYGFGFCEHWWIADLINDVSTVAYGFNGIQNHGTACAKSTKIKYALKIF